MITLNIFAKKGFSSVLMIRRLKQIRSVLELAVPVWQPGLTIWEEKQIERVQKTTFYVILGDYYQSYESSLKLLGAEPLAKRRESICLNFAKKALKHPKHQHWFSENHIEPNLPPPSKTRAGKLKVPVKQPKFKPVKARTRRYRDSPIPYMTKLLNSDQ